MGKHEDFLQHIQDCLHILDDFGALDMHVHSRMRVYPREPSETIQLSPDAVADVYGAWTECIPANTILFPFHLVGYLVEDQQAADTFFLQFASSATPLDTEIMGEGRLRLGGLAGFFPSIPQLIRGQNFSANTPVYGRVKTAAGTNWIKISLVLTRCIPVTNEVAMWPDWPW